MCDRITTLETHLKILKGLSPAMLPLILSGRAWDMKNTCMNMQNIVK